MAKKTKKTIVKKRSTPDKRRAGEKLSNPEIAEFKLCDLNLAEYNPRRISEESLAGLTASLQRYGCVEPIVVNVRGGRNIIVGGHQRLKALLRLKQTSATCVTVDLGKDEEKMLNVTLNNPAIQGEFIKKIEDYILLLHDEVGQDEAFIELRINQLSQELACQESQGLIEDDDVPEPPKKTKTKPGDLWILGKHRLLCGDSTNPEDVKRLMGRSKAKLFATDPPYCVDYTGKDRPNGGKDWSDVYREVDIPDAAKFITDFLTCGLWAVAPNTAIYLWHADKRVPEIRKVTKELGILIHQPIIWVKPCVVIAYSVYSWRHEPCFLMWQKGQRPRFKPSGKKIGSVWSAGLVRSGDPNSPEYYTDIWQADWDGKKRPVGFDHPTSKPVELFAIPMRVHTDPGDICYEPFSGSGTQIIAAEKLNRRCFAMEKEPYFCDVALKRWEKWTGKKAKRQRK